MRRRTVVSSLLPLMVSGCLRLTEGNQEETGAQQNQAGPDTDQPEEEDGSSREEDGNRDDENGSETTNSGEENRTEEAETSFPAGLSNDGVSAILADTHAIELFDRSFELDFSIQDATAEWDLGEQIAKEGERILQRNPWRNLVRYYDGDDFWWELRHRGQTLYGLADVVGEPHFTTQTKATMAGHLAAFLRVASYDGPSQEDERPEAVYTVSAEDVDDADALSERWGREYDVQDVSATLAVDPDGIIDSFEGRFEATYDGGADHLLESEFAAQNIGETSLSEPGWVETARKRAPVLEVSSDDSVVEIIHEAGQEIPSDTTVELVSPAGESYRTTLESVFAEGETLFVWMAENEITVSTSEPASDIRELTDEWHFKMTVAGGVYVEKGLDIIS